jgi:hypothetical protein
MQYYRINHDLDTQFENKTNAALIYYLPAPQWRGAPEHVFKFILKRIIMTNTPVTGPKAEAGEPDPPGDTPTAEPGHSEAR